MRRWGRVHLTDLSANHQGFLPQTAVSNALAGQSPSRSILRTILTGGNTQTIVIQSSVHRTR
jgi:hypothetical protein